MASLELVESFLSYPVLIVLALISIASYFIYQNLLGLKQSNPFERNTSRPPAQELIDPTTRDRVLKQGFTAKEIPEDLDAIVIGSGIGGLGVASILSRVGKKVLVLEQHDQAGGCCHTFVDKGFEFDVGVHYVGEMEGPWKEARFFCDQLTDGQLDWAPIEKAYDIVALGPPGQAELFSIVSGKAAWKRQMLLRFANEEQALDKFLQLVEETQRHWLMSVTLKVLPFWLGRLLIKTKLIYKVTKYFKLAAPTLQQTLDSLTNDETLKAVLAYSFGDYASLPEEASFAMHAGLFCHFLDGAFYPRGGPSMIAYHIIPTIERTGGKVLVRAPVSEILMENGRAVGVRVKRSTGDVDIRAPLIISDAGVHNTLHKLLPKQVAERTRLWKHLDDGSLRPCVACLQVFVGLRGTTEELELRASNTWAYTGTNLSELCSSYLKKSADEALEGDLPLLFISFPSAKDPTYNQRYPGRSVCVVVTLVNWQWFEQWRNEPLGNRGSEYDALKTQLGQRVWDQVLELYPQLENKVEYLEIGTPVSHNYYLGYSQGETYSLDHNQPRLADPEIVLNLRPDIGVPGLLLTGQDVLSVGFTGAMFGGLICSCAALKRNVFGDLIKLRDKHHKSK